MTEHNWLAREVTELAQVNERLIMTAQEENRDLADGESDIITRNAGRLEQLQGQLDTIKRAESVRSASLESLAMLGGAMNRAQVAEVEYTSAGQYAIDVWRAGCSVPDAEQRLRRYNQRVAAHDLTSDVPGIIPAPVVGQIINFIDATRPVLNFVGVQTLPGGPTFNRPRVTQHTSVAAQTAEKAELVSQKLTITSTPVTVATLGGYVNVSRQLIDWTNPDGMQIIINDLAAQYALQTENRAVDAWVAGGTAGGGTIPATGGTAQAIAAAIWGAAAKVYTATQGQGRVFVGCGPDVLALIAGAFAPINPTNAYGEGFSAGNYAPGVVGSISGIPVVMSPAFDAGKAFVASTAAVEAYEQKIGTLQVIEPSVLGVQVAYAGYFANVIIAAGGVQLLIVA